MLGNEPVLEEIPISREDLFPETQLVFYLYDKLSSKWEGFSGTYLGKDLSILPILFDEYEYEPYLRKYAWDIIPLIDKFVAEDIARQVKSKSKGELPGGK